MAATALEIEKNPKFKELVAARKSLGWSLSFVMLAIYFGFILLVAFNKDLGNLLGMPLGAGTRHHGRHRRRPAGDHLRLPSHRHLRPQG